MEIKNIVRKNIQNLAPYSSARDEYKALEGIFLDANENPFGTYNRYPDPYQKELKERLAQLKNVKPSQIFIGNGSDEVIDLAFRIFCEPNQDKVLVFNPTYGMYEVAANINSVEIIDIPLTTDFQIDIEKTKPFLSDKNIKLIFICSPNNPSGNSIDFQSIEFILKNFHGIVVVDEAYIDFCDVPSLLNSIEKYPNLIVSQTLSKAWGLAGLRVGLAFMNEEILAYYNKVKPPYNVSVINQKTALEALENEALFRKNLQEIISEREKMIENLKKLSIVKKIYPSDANFLLVEVSDANKIYNQLINKQIIIRNRNSVVKNCIRITIGNSEENQKLLNALNEISNG